MFANPIGLFALLAVPAVLALHLFRRRFERREVSGLFLWESADRSPESGRRREPPRSNLSLWCELLCAALLALAFSGPRSSCAGARGEHFVAVLDSSASMAARSEVESARDRAAARIRQRIEALPRGSRVTLVRSGRRPQLLAGPAAFPAQALEALELWRPSSPRHELERAVSLAAQFAGESRIAVYTDHFDVAKWPANCELVAVGEPLDNWAITHAARTAERTDDGRDVERVFVTVASFADEPRELEITVKQEGVEPRRESAQLAPGARVHLAFEVAEGAVEAALAGDALAIDDACFLAPEPRRTLALHSELADETARELALSREDGDIERWRAVVPRSVESDDPARAHLVFGRDSAQPGRWRIELAQLGAERRDLLGPFLLDRTHRALDGVTLDGVVWSADPDLELPGVPLVSVGSLALMSEERAGDATTWRFNFDASRSSLQRSPDWPILLANLAEIRRARLPGPERANLAAGSTLAYQPGAEAAGAERSQPLEYQLEGPLGAADASARILQTLGRFEHDELERPGFYRLSFEEVEVARLGVSFLDDAESDLRAASSGRRESPLAAAAADEELSWLELAALVAALALLGLDWWSLGAARAGRAS